MRLLCRKARNHNAPRNDKKKEKVLLIGYGSIGRRHTRNLLGLGFTPCVLTSHPDSLDVEFSNNIKKFKRENIKSCIISSPTASHLADLTKCLKIFGGLKKVLIEKPMESSYAKAEEIKRTASRYGVEVYVAYNLRFIDGFDLIAEFIKEKKDKIRIVEIVAGQDLKEWRPGKDIRQSYSAHRRLGGGVDLDLSHELDYALHLFGNGFKGKLMHRDKISNLDIKSPDVFKLVLYYKRFIVDMMLDYIRKPAQRYIKITCEDEKTFHHEFLKSDIAGSHKRMLKAFLGIDRAAKQKLCTLEEGLNVLRVLGV